MAGYAELEVRPTLPDGSVLTDEELRISAEAAVFLQPGKWYDFYAPVTALAKPVAGPDVCVFKSDEVHWLQFSRGWYINFKNNFHHFQGLPMYDPRALIIVDFDAFMREHHVDNPKDIIGTNLVRNHLHACYFATTFCNGVAVKLSANQRNEY